MGFKLRVWGDVACFPRPELRRDTISYDILTPLAAREIYEAIHWKPALRWHIDRIRILKPIRSEWNSIDERLGGEREPPPVRRLVLRDVDYVIEAHFELTSRAGPAEKAAQHADTFRRRARKGGFYRQPCFGLSEYPASFLLIDDGAEPPPGDGIAEHLDFGWVTHDFSPFDANELRYFRARAVGGVLTIPPYGSDLLVI